MLDKEFTAENYKYQLLQFMYETKQIDVVRHWFGWISTEDAICWLPAATRYSMTNKFANYIWKEYIQPDYQKDFVHEFKNSPIIHIETEDLRVYDLIENEI